jgi:hypothetical protein
VCDWLVWVQDDEVAAVDAVSGDLEGDHVNVAIVERHLWDRYKETVAVGER